jgi:hypothetical protein
VEGFGAHYAVTLHRAELRQAAGDAHEHRGIGMPRLRWPWRFAIGGARKTASYVKRVAADVTDLGQPSEQFVWP